MTSRVTRTALLALALCVPAFPAAAQTDGNPVQEAAVASPPPLDSVEDVVPGIPFKEGDVIGLADIDKIKNYIPTGKNRAWKQMKDGGFFHEDFIAEVEGLALEAREFRERLIEEEITL